MSYTVVSFPFSSIALSSHHHRSLKEFPEGDCLEGSTVCYCSADNRACTTTGLYNSGWCDEFRWGMKEHSLEDHRETKDQSGDRWHQKQSRRLIFENSESTTRRTGEQLPLVKLQTAQNSGPSTSGEKMGDGVTPLGSSLSQTQQRSLLASISEGDAASTAPPASQKQQKDGDRKDMVVSRFESSTGPSITTVLHYT